MRYSRVLLVISFGLAVASVWPASSTAQEQAAELHALFDEAWEFELQENPLFATSVGERRYDDRLPSVRAQDQARRAGYRRGVLERLKQIDRSALGDVDRVSHDMFERQLLDRLSEFEFKTYEMPINADWGFHIGFARLPDDMTLGSVRDYENYLDRLRAFPDYVNQQVRVMRSGLERGFSVPQVTLEGYEETIAAHVVGDPESSVFYAPFASFPSTIPGTEHNRLRAAARVAIMESVVPAYRAFHDFMTGDYIPNARTTIGASELPDGREYYAYLIKHFTTLDLTAEQIHEIGLEEVGRIRSEMMDIIEEVGFSGDFAAFLEFLRTDPRFYAETPDELLKEATYLAKQMDGKLPSLFKTMPRLPYGVAPVPEELAPKFTAGRYIDSPVGSTQPGYYWVNTYRLASRPLYTLPALTLHEAVPGHHLQTALAREQEGLPAFRRHAYINAFGEGWGLYSEWLGIEAGMYPDPYSRFGRLTYEMWRACRLVVDTGIHAMGWSRDQVMEYMAANTALSLHEVRTETDRYISWPGQALSYKMGELTIRQLRDLAETELGERFDVREFHDVVLLNGTVPLTVLAEQVKRWINSP
ncbi:MAG: DUF885 domain-containing protein [Gemmatimonadales bacterium]|nr:DUF885 domain-containing protein [Gemmatimonadales bacterium]